MNDTMKTVLLLVIFLVYTSCNRTTLVNDPGPDLIEPTILHVNGSDLFQYWDIDKNDSEFILTNERGLDIYKDSLLQVLGKESLDNILRMERSNDGAVRVQRAELQQGEIENYKLAHSGMVGTIRPINHLEYQILNYQASRYPLLSHPTEFGAFILANDKLKRLRICYAGGEKPWPPRPDVIFDHMDKVLKEDWYLSTFLHNHFEPDTAGFVGLLAPSMSDAQYFEMLRDNFKIPNVLITNGFHTVVLDSTHFYKFKQHE